MNTSKIFSGSKKNLVVPCSEKAPRNGEGSTVLLKSGKVFIAYTCFTSGGKDHDKAVLVGGILDINTGSLTETGELFASESSLNEMSVSLERLNDGSIGMIFIRKLAKDKDIVFFTKSKDEAKTWSEPVNVSKVVLENYIVVNCDHLRQFSSGRLALPGAFYPEGKCDQRSDLGMFYSDDNGKTWKCSERLKIRPENIRQPHKLAEGMEEICKETHASPSMEQEPGVEELSDGRILLYCRTVVGYMYQAFSSDGGETWSELKAAPEIITPCGPQAIRRIPGQKRLLCVFNDRSNVDFLDQKKSWSWRTPQSIAVSDDNAATWKILGNIEDDSHNYCYTSILFVENKIVLTYYESENSIAEDGKPQRRNLASLKMQVLNLKDVSC